MRFALVISLALHASLIVVTVYGLPHLLDEPPPAQQIMVVELVEIAEETTPQLPELQQVDETRPPDASETAPEAAKEAEQIEAPPPATAEAPPPPPPPASSEVKVALAAPTAPTPIAEAQPAPTPAPKPVEVKPEAPPPPPEIKPAEIKPEAAPPPPEIKPAEVKAATPPPPPQAKPTPIETVQAPEAKPIEGTEVASAPVPKRKPREEPKKKDFKRTMSRVAALLDKSREDTPETANRAKRAAAPSAERSAAKNPRTRGQAVRLDQRMTIREIDAIKLQIEQCWTVPAGARDAAELIIRIRIQLNRDGSLARPPEVLDGHKLRRRGGFQRAAAESALRAVNTCQPLRNLPVAKFDQWRDITLSFDPREMLGR